MAFIKLEDIQSELKKSVFGQDELIKSLAVIAWIYQVNQMRKRKHLDPINNKTLIIGPSGCGKTYAVKKLASILKTCFIEIDCTKIQGNNYVGSMHAADLFDEAISSYGKNAVENGIIFLDEFDKTLDVYQYKHSGSRYVQRDLLKIFEGSIVDTKNHGKINTSYMTIICAGSFCESTDSLHLDNNSVSKMGFGQVGINNENEHKKCELCVEDLITMGHLPELVGRFSRIINMNLLTEEDIFNILKKGENQIKLFTEQLSDMGIKLEYKDGYYRYLAENVAIAKTGFRDVNKLICEDIDDIITRLINDNILNVVVDYKDNKVICDFYNIGNKLLDRFEKDCELTRSKTMSQNKSSIYLYGGTLI